MLRRIFGIAVLIFLVGVQAAFSSAAENNNYKIRRLVSQLYEKSKCMDAQRKLSIYGTEATEYLLPIIRGKDADSVRVAAISVIEKVKDATAEDDIVLLLSDRSHRVRQAAARALAEIGSKTSTIEALKKLLSDYDPDVRYNAIRALSVLARKDEAGLFINALGDYDPRVRMFAVVALGKVKYTEAVPYLAQMVREYDPAVRFELTRALGNIGTAECLQPLVSLTSDPDLGIRIKAIDEISSIDTKEAEDALVEATVNFDPKIAERAIYSLTERKSSKILSIAEKHIDAEHMSVKLACINAIGRMGGKAQEALLKGLLKAESTAVRKAADQALAKIAKK